MKPDHVEALCNRGLALRGLGRLQEALDGFDRAIMLAPAYPDAHNGRGVVLVDLKRFEEALASFDKAIALAPRHAEAHYNRANTLGELRRFEEALAGFDQVIALQPDNAAAHNNRGSMLTALGRLQDALQSYQQALTHDPRLVEALNNCGCTLTELGRPDEACASYEKALAVAPAHRLVLDGLAKAALHACSWKLVQDIKPKLELHIGEGRSLITPFTLLGYHDRPDLQLRAATAYVAGELSNTKASRWQGRLSRRPKLPIAYLSSDFRQHPVAFLMAEMFELHDRDRFEVIGVSWGRDDGSAIRGRICRAFDSLVEVTLRRNDREVAQELRARQIAIAVDLNGLTTSHRIGIFAHGAAPIQVGYLGYPGTTGTSFVDYVVADPIVLPLDQQPYWTERIVHLPVCYLPNDGKRTLPTRPVTRAEFGLPETGFVFCCFNNSWKITPAMFDVWMRLLRDVPGSVLWLMNTSASAERNLRREAEARGVGADRIVFAQRVKEMDLHLARHRLADLCLDTLPYNAHATASDALWMATPFVTCPGVSFSSRVGASLLHDAGLSELICRDLGEYEATARRLAAEPERLKSIKARLEANRLKNALFDSRRRCRALEQAYLTMWEIHQRGESRRAFAVGD